MYCSREILSAQSRSGRCAARAPISNVEPQAPRHCAPPAIAEQAATVAGRAGYTCTYTELEAKDLVPCPRRFLDGNCATMPRLRPKFRAIPRSRRALGCLIEFARVLLGYEENVRL